MKNNKKLFKRLLSAVILLCVVFSLAAPALSCANEESPNNPGNNNEGKADDNPLPVNAENGNNDGETTTEESFDPNLPEADYGGYEFRILNINQEAMWWAIVDADVEEQNGEVVNDAIYTRNRNVEDKYNFVTKEYRNEQSRTRECFEKKRGRGNRRL